MSHEYMWIQNLSKNGVFYWLTGHINEEVGIGFNVMKISKFNFEQNKLNIVQLAYASQFEIKAGISQNLLCFIGDVSVTEEEFINFLRTQTYNYAVWDDFSSN